MKLRKGEIISILILAVFYAAVFYLMPIMPDKMISHWGISGQANGWMLKVPAMLIMPVLGTIIVFLFLVLTRLEPAKTGIESFASAFDAFVNILLLFLVYISGLMAAANLNVKFDMAAAFAPAFAGLLYAVSLIMERSKPNYIIGIRTKETLNDPEVWAKVHGKAGELFRYCALISLGGLFFPRLLVLFMVVPLFVTTVYLASYAKKISKPL